MTPPNLKWFFLSIENPKGTYNAGIEVYKGINLVYRKIQGQRGVWGAEENQEGSSNPYIQDYVAHQDTIRRGIRRCRE